MPPLSLASDPLWMCLCPSWSRSVAQVTRSAGQTLRHKPQKRLFTASPRQHIFGEKSKRQQNRRAIDGPRNYNYGDLSSPALCERLRVTAVKGHTQECREIVQYLIETRGERPTLQMYNHLILSNANGFHGSAGRVYQLLAEMEHRNLDPDNVTCHNALRALAVHPDHLLQDDILKYMKKKWFSLSDTGQCDVIVGLLRDGCFEMALDALEKLQRTGSQVPSWLTDMAAYMLSDAGEMDAAYQIMRKRWNANESDISSALWYWLLDKASSTLHDPMTEFIWRTRVSLGRTDASMGMCNNALSTAARAGNAALATQIFGYLTKRGEKLTGLHFQLLIDSYMNRTSPDLENAFSILSLMSLERVPATKYHTRTIYMALKDSPELLGGMLGCLRKLHNEGRAVPVAALNVLIECYAAQDDFRGALNVYKQIHSFSSGKRQLVDVETFHHLLKACRSDEKVDISQAEFLLSEIKTSSIQPDLLIYDRLILIWCKASAGALQSSDAEQARHHVGQAIYLFEECQQAQFVPRYGTVDTLATRLAELGDCRCWDLLQFAVDQHRSDWDARLVPVRKKLEGLWDEAMRRSPVNTRANVDSLRAAM